MKKIEEIRHLIGIGKLDLAIDTLMKWLDSYDGDLYQNAIVIRSSMIDFRKSLIAGILSSEDERVQLQKIKTSVLNLAVLAEKQIELEKKVAFLSKKQKRFVYNYFLLLSLLACVSLWGISSYKQNIKYSKDLAKKEEYIKVLQMNKSAIERSADIVGKKIPMLKNFILEYDDLSKRHIIAVQSGDYSYKAEIISKIRQLPQKYGLNNLLDDPGISNRLSTSEMSVFGDMVREVIKTSDYHGVIELSKK